MESDLLKGDAVHPRFGRCKMAHDRERVVAHGLFQIRIEERGPDLGPGAVVVVILMSLNVPPAVIMPVSMPLMPGHGRLDDEAAAPENAIMMGHETALDWEIGGGRPYAGDYSSLVFGKGIE